MERLLKTCIDLKLQDMDGLTARDLETTSEIKQLLNKSVPVTWILVLFYCSILNSLRLEKKSRKWAKILINDYNSECALSLLPLIFMFTCRANGLWAFRQVCCHQYCCDIWSSHLDFNQKWFKASMYQGDSLILQKYGCCFL